MNLYNQIIQSILLNQPKTTILFEHLKGDTKVCNTHLNDFLHYAKKKKKLHKKQIHKFFSLFGFPTNFLHNTPFLNCESCRKKKSIAAKKNNNNLEKRIQFILRLEQIYNEIELGIFKRVSSNKTDTLFRKRAYFYAIRTKNPSIPFIEKMRLYKNYQEQKSLLDLQSDFYSTKNWKILRGLVIEAYGCSCMKCGLENLAGYMLHCDHILPRSLFPEYALKIDNLQILCISCNSSKSNRNKIDHRPLYWFEKLQKIDLSILEMISN